MEKRAVIAIALAIVVLLLFRYYEDRRATQSTRRTPSRITPTVTPQPPVAPPAPPVKPPESVKTAPLPYDTSATARTVIVGGPLYRAVLDNRGAVLTSWQLKKHKSDKGEPFEMVAASHSPESRPYPGSLVFQDPTLNQLTNGELYEVNIENSEGSGDELIPPAAVHLRLRRGDIMVEKSYRFYPDNYVVDFTATVERGGKPLAGRMLLAQDIGPEHEHLLNPSLQLQAVFNSGGKVVREGPPKDENEIRKMEGELGWVGLDMQYFSIIAIPARPLSFFEMQRRPVKTAGLDGKEVSRDLLRLTLPLEGSLALKMFVGPKEKEYLQGVNGTDLSAVIDFGMFSILVHPLLFSLKWIEQYVHNYGYAIILLTLLLTLLLFPFRFKQMVSMKKMAVVQPKVKQIQERYKKYKKTDPRRAQMNQEVMAIYKEHNVNPLGGCLPLLLQMPLLFAFYQLLASSIELRHAPFVGWIHDLSAKDPYWVLPIIMGVTMLISQKMTPMTPGADPAQAKIMMAMPIVFTFMFLNVSSGLNLYFLCSNIFQIAFQKLTEGLIDGRKSAVRTTG